MQVLNVNGSEKVLIDGLYYFDNSMRQKERTGKLKGWVFADIVKCIYRTMENHPNEIYRAVASFGRDKDIQIGDSVAMVDINHCYLQVAHKLGYISKKDYGRILKKYADIKIDVCAAFTSLFKETSCTYISPKMRVERTIICHNYELEIVRDNIINYSNSIMAGFKGQYYTRNVDGIWIPFEELEALKAYLEPFGLSYKIAKGIFLDKTMLYDSELDKIIYI